MLQGAADAEEELIFFEGLQDVVVGAATDGFEGGGNVVDGGDHDHGHFGVILPEPVEEFDAVHFRHDHVAQDQVRCDALDLVLGRAAIADRGAL